MEDVAFVNESDVCRMNLSRWDVFHKSLSLGFESNMKDDQMLLKGAGYWSG